MQSVAKFVTKAYPVSGCCDYLSEVRTGRGREGESECVRTSSIDALSPGRPVYQPSSSVAGRISAQKARESLLSRVSRSSRVDGGRH